MKEGLRKEELRKDIMELMDKADTYRLTLVRAYIQGLMGASGRSGGRAEPGKTGDDVNKC